MTDRLDKRSLLDVAIRFLGIYQFLAGCFDIVYSLNMSERLRRGVPETTLPYIVFQLFAGIILFFAAPVIVRFAYGKKRKTGQVH